MPNLAVNKKATFEYEILEKLEAGLMLTGAEVKSVRNGNIRLLGAYVTFHGTSANLLNAHISPYKYAQNEEYDPTVSRRLLLKQKEINYLRGKLSEKGLTIIPLSVYTKGNLIKIESGVGRGKKTFDKRESVKKRDQKREIAKKLKYQ
jgi:SsrA-binding protein